MGKKRQARKITEKQLKNIKTGPSNKEWFWINFVMLSAVIILSSFALTNGEDTREYYHSHNTLFVMIIIAFISFVVREEVRKHMFLSIKKLAIERRKIDMYEVGDILLALAYLLAFASFLIVDFSFLQNFGLKISAVVAVNLYIMLKTFVFNKSKS